ncbi:hypothetical protein ACFY6U_51180 [Streptomyces sp. NPDC013157]|uniref:hypothetical protein n=1 Tax=Streptomyces sp. NPDC013157 TaxID=3364861 RepID=UPI0036C4F065
MSQKAPSASRVITQICFDASTAIDWARRVHRRHPDLDVVGGVPALVNWRKLLRISASSGLAALLARLGDH